MKKHVLLIWALCLSVGLFAQDFNLPCGNLNFKPEVQTVLFFADDNQLNDPIIPLDDMMERLTLSFDIIDGQGEVLNYTFIHCSHDWQPSDIQRLQYASGFDSDRLDDYAFSRNTLIDYVNYQLKFPKEDMMPLISGNYLLIVFRDDLTDDNVLFTRRFMVLDEKAHVGATVPRYPDDLSLTDTHQQLDVRVNMDNYLTGNTQQFSYLTIRQNGRWDNAAEGLKPTYVYPDYISFEHHPQTVFEATNQYRRINTSNFYFQSENLAHIRQTDESYEIDVATCESRARKAYASYEDIHGEKFIYVENENLDNATEADYCRVNFFYKSEAPLTHEDLYIMGAISDWRFDESNKMRYDYRLHGYTCSMMLKQGYYNFMFVTVDRQTYEVSTDLTAGNHWETNNVYKLYFYFHNALKGYDELIGYSTVNSH
ncbi:MAG: DUF5103 domain-containing protein [Bacteroidales bacterium]|nr:DUF5103 domain-containing protein [Bacteroidales bacterium]